MAIEREFILLLRVGLRLGRNSGVAV